MRHPIAKIAALALVAPLAGSVLFAPAASAAPSKAPAAAVKKADDPYSSFDVRVSAPKKVRAGGKISYTIQATNVGPHLADSYWIGGVPPKGSKITAIYGPEGTRCAWFDDGYWCIVPQALEVDDRTAIRVVVKLSKKARGTATGYWGVDSVDLPTGAENLDRDEFKRMGIKSWYFLKKVKTKIVR
ncbi:hypothetical protein [Planomonospora venezuelensis]|uniref:Peptidoglycan/xylan/chitin deacetylase (PgdA/CDA1 family) n=1 Tax=Planomonospora venezuelensis TaxID=1999 RepID=A0A841CYW4_PLAVE|nr:hypothetical protein [Planomonospora venezuelensis]MBB5961135.1 peptidoglycan/xylan/chitin deacetylase (PgdA/CDA1 family) [Planomonospora venezuelensis]GIM99805.1 hypothetical protein Pve01_14640 [Planomonospora venezuelensis]